MLNLLTEPLITVRTPEGTEGKTLPGAMATLMGPGPVTFPALQPHQEHAWHSFCVQLAAISLRQAGLSDTPQDETGWAQMLLELTRDWPGQEPWSLLCDNPQRPAFMQPPVNDLRRAADLKKAATSPQGIDTPVSSKNYEVKAAYAGEARPEHWIFTLITLQTMAGFDGKGLYGISRMNGGLASRPAVSLAPLNCRESAVRRDTQILLRHRESVIQQHGYNPEGHQLLWLLPWEGEEEETLDLPDLDPWYIEVCRRVRLSRVRGRIEALKGTTKGPRTGGKELKGRTGDPWTPTDPEREGLPLTLPAAGFTYRRIASLLTDWDKPLLLQPTPEEAAAEEGMLLVCRAMTRGQGKTEGYHERQERLGPRMLKAMAGSSPAGEAEGPSSELKAIIESRTEQIRTSGQILGHAIRIHSGKDEKEQKGENPTPRYNPWVGKLEQSIGQNFLESLQEELEADPAARAELRKEWLHNRRDGITWQARRALEQYLAEAPKHGNRELELRTAAESALEARIYRSVVLNPPEETEDAGPAGSPETMPEPPGG